MPKHNGFFHRVFGADRFPYPQNFLAAEGRETQIFSDFQILGNLGSELETKGGIQQGGYLNLSTLMSGYGISRTATVIARRAYCVGEPKI